MKLILEQNDWKLFDRKKSKNGWVSLKLTPMKNLRKRNFWLGWNTEEKRFSRNNDNRILAEYYPSIYSQVQSFLEKTEE